ncbi:hypothetical protein SAICODRAFT_139793 [Saitoella complicata NRRL Y-17804]|uniref:uncharacterized protein n=1 Tax=Saitoella complicata (strain BCRC 22490 / CBS 7301 / JCM 7358 / NBRC 10748 / NRRL Y-17804) TaxID=698492 RepID=UPI000867B426|nr:uncharacterized protein SAICODRAFT_139793 [Saitoella complicata NRRL Y-17804]ODQ51893.1 hypothetical protein SAICODRAFT_139793 [Saitoella complicata NRRL Y-17804]
MSYTFSFPFAVTLRSTPLPHPPTHALTPPSSSPFPPLPLSPSPPPSTSTTPLNNLPTPNRPPHNLLNITRRNPSITDTPLWLSGW